jgi:hypothetical protein
MWRVDVLFWDFLTRQRASQHFLFRLVDPQMKAPDLLTTYTPLSLLFDISLLVIVQPYSFLFSRG